MVVFLTFDYLPLHATGPATSTKVNAINCFENGSRTKWKSKPCLRNCFGIVRAFGGFGNKWWYIDRLVLDLSTALSPGTRNVGDDDCGGTE